MDRFHDLSKRARLVGSVFLFIWLAFIHTAPIFAHNVTTTSISGSSTASTYGESVTFTATVIDSASNGIMPSGMVTFKDGVTDIGTATLSGTAPTVAVVSANSAPSIPSDMKVSCSDLNCPVVKWGDYTYWAFSYFDNRVSMGIVAFDSSGSIVKQWEKEGSRYLSQITIDSGTQTVTFWGQSNQTIVMGWADLENATASASFNVSSLAVGSHSIKAVFTGGGAHTGSTSVEFIHNVNAVGSMTSLSSNANSTTYGNAVDLKATVTSSGGYVPTGTVSFKEGGKTLGSAVLSGGIATFSTTSLSVGTHAPITAVYVGDSIHSGSSSSGLSQVVNPMVASISLISSSNTAAYGDTVTFTATLPALNGETPSGFITFKDGSSILNTSLLSNGKATIASSAIALGSHTITAEYAGDAMFSSGVSNAVPLQIIQSSNANLNGLTLQGISLNPPFQTGVYSYSATVSNSVYVINVLSSLEDPTADVKVNSRLGTPVSNGQISTPIDLSVGTNTIQIIVTAQNGMTQAIYTVLVTRAGSDNADLNALTLSSGRLNPTFSSGILGYSSTVSNSVYSVTVTPKALGIGSTVKVNGIAVSEGQASTSIQLNVGSNLISVEVTAQDGKNKKTYSILVMRSAAERLGVTQALMKISAMYDSNQDGKFDADDVRELLLQIESVVIR